MNCKIRIQFATILACISLLGVSCAKKNDNPNANNNGSSSTNSSLKMTLRGSNLGKALSKQASQQGPRFVAAPTTGSDPVDCKAFFVLGDKAASSATCGGQTPCYPNAGTRKGSCLTPISVTGKATQGDLLGSSAPGGSRILSAGNSGGGKNDVYLTGEAIDLSNPVTLTGVDNLEDHTDFNSKHSQLSLSFEYLDVKVAVPRTLNNQPVTHYWTVRYIFNSLPFTSEANNTCTTSCVDAAELDCTTTCTPKGETIGQCLDALAHPGASDAADLVAKTHFGGLTGVRIGDILVCTKTTSAEACSALDWKWLDKSLNNNAGGFTSTRPSVEANIWKFNHIAGHSATCAAQTDSQGMNVNLGGWGFRANLYDPVGFNATIDQGLKVYQFTDSAGTTQKGSDVALYIDIDIKNSVILYDEENKGATSLAFADLGTSFANLRALSDASLLRKLWFKPIFAYEFSGCDPWKPGSCSNIPNGLKAELKVELSGATEPPIYQCEAAKGAASTDCVGNQDPATHP